MRIKHFCITVTVVAMVAATGAQGQDNEFTAAVDNSWENPGNWSLGHVPLDEPVIVGNAAYPDVSVVMHAGTSASIGAIEITNSGNGTVTIEEGAAIEGTNSGWIGYAGGADYTATLNVDGSYTISTYQFFMVAGRSNAVVNLGATGTIETYHGLLVGLDYYMDDDKAFEYVFNHNGGTTTNWRAFYMQGMYENCLYRFNGGEINCEDAHPGTGYSYWHMGGTMEIAADSTVNIDPNYGGLAVLAQGNWKGYGAPILKFTGTDSKLTMNGDVDFLSPNHPGDTIPAQLDVNEFNVSAADTWVTVIDANSITNGDQLALVAGTDANIWQMQVVGDLVQVKYTGDIGCIMGDVNCSGCVDDDDLSLLLANWNIGDEWGEGDLNENGTVNDDDLSLLLANWGAGCSPAPDAVPEPLTLSLLVLGGCGLIVRRRR
jgi:hypothetical protein